MIIVKMNYVVNRIWYYTFILLCIIVKKPRGFRRGFLMRSETGCKRASVRAFQRVISA